MAGSEKTFGVRIVANVDSYMAALDRARVGTAAMSRESQANFAKLGAQMQNVGGQMTRLVTLPLLAAGAGALKLSMDFDSAFTRMINLAGVTADEVTGLKESVLDLARKTGQAPVALANALYEAKSAGLDTAHAMEALDVAAEGAAVGMGSAKDIVGLVASAIASYGAANISAAQATDILTAAVRDGRADPTELAGSLGRILPVASALGISFGEVGGATAYLSNIIGDTGRTVTGLYGVLNKLYAPSKQAQQTLEDMGTSAGALKQAISQDGLQGALQLLRDHGFADNSGAARKLFDDVDALSAATALLKDNSGSLAHTIDDVTHSQGALSNAFGNTSKTDSFKMKQAWSEIQVALIKAGGIILPIVAGVAGAIGHLANGFGDLPKPVQMAIVGLLGLAATAGPLIVMAGTVLKNFGLIQTAARNMSLSVSGIGSSMSSIGAGLGVLAAGYAAIAAIDALEGRNGDTRTQMNALLAASNDKAVDSTYNMVDAFGSLSQAVQDTKDNVATVGDMFHWQTDAEFNFRSMSEAFNQLMTSSPAAAQKLIQQLQDVDKAAQSGNAGAKQWMDGWGLSSATIASWATQTTNAIGAQNALTGATTDALAPVQDLTGGTTDLGTATKMTAAEVETARHANFAWNDEVAKMAVNENATKDALDAATDALDRQVTALEADMKAQLALVDFARGAADAQYALADSTDGYNKFLEDLPKKLSDINKSSDSQAEKQRQINELYREGTKEATKMADDTVAAYDQASNGTLTATQKLDIWNSSALRQASLASGPLRQSILDYISATNKIPTDVATLIAAYIDQGRFDEANALLDSTSTMRTAAVQADVDDGSIIDAKAQIQGIKDFAKTGVAPVTVTANTDSADAAVAAMISRWSRLGASFSPKVHTPSSTGATGAVPVANGGFIGSPSLRSFASGGVRPGAKKGNGNEGEMWSTTHPFPRQTISFPDPFQDAVDQRVRNAVNMYKSRRKHADGSLPDQATIQPPGTLVQWAEPETGGESFIPLALSKRDRSRAIWEQTGRLLGLDFMMFANGGMTGAPNTAGAASVMRDLFTQGALSSADYGAYLSANNLSWQPPNTAGSATGATTVAPNDDDLMSRKFEKGKISGAEYLKYLEDEGKAETALNGEFSDRAMELWRRAEQLKRDELAESAKAADDDAAKEDRRQQWLFDTQQISLAQYQDYLRSRQASYEQFSADWISVTTKMADLEKQAADARANTAADAIKAMFDQMRLANDLTAAIKEQADTWSDLQDKAVKAYMTAMDPNSSADEKASAADDYEAAKARAAAAVIAGADARANESGLADDTPEWAAFMRSQIEAFIPGHGEIASQLQDYLSHLPMFALGGVIQPRVGGTLGVLAERGEAEHVVRDSRLEQIEGDLGALRFAMASMQYSVQAAPVGQRQLAMAGGPSNLHADVRVFVGDREITDIVRTEIDMYDLDTAQEIQTGMR